MLPIPVTTTKPIGWIKRRRNLREIRRDESLKELERSIAQYNILNPLVALDDGTLVCGYRRLECAELLGISEVPVSIYPASLDERQVSAIQAVENLAREDLSEQEIYKFCDQCEAAGMTRAEIAVATGKSPGSITRYLSPNDCPPLAKEYFLAGRLTLGKCYKIATSDEPLATTQVFLGGATIAEADAQAGGKPAKRQKSDSTRVSSLKIAFYGGKTVIVKGRDMTLGDVVEILADAKAQAEVQRDEGQDARTFEGMMANKAKKAPGDKPKKRGRKSGNRTA